jgi:hypothetical protein
MKKYYVTWVFILASTILCGQKAAQRLSVDSDLERKFFELLSDVKESRFSGISVEKMEEVILESCQFKRRGGLVFGHDYESFSYDLVLSDIKHGRYSVELLTETDGKPPSERLVIAVRIVYTSDGGVSYYNYVIPESWPARYFKGPAKAMSEPTSQPMHGGNHCTN